MTANEERLRRELRAATAVNRQLQAQLDANGSGTSPAAPTASASKTAPATGPLPRRHGVGRSMLAELAAIEVREVPFLVRPPSGPVQLIEAGKRRAVVSTIIAATLERAFGEARRVNEKELDRWAVGVPVEVFEGPKGSPFLVVHGQRYKLRGLPVPYPVSSADAQRIPSGPLLNVSSANVSKFRYRRAMKGKQQVLWLKDGMRRAGPFGILKALARKMKQMVR